MFKISTMNCKCKEPQYHKKDNDKTDSLWCRTCENKIVEEMTDEEKELERYYLEEQEERENEERYYACTCGSWTINGIRVADCICGNT